MRKCSHCWIPSVLISTVLWILFYSITPGTTCAQNPAGRDVLTVEDFDRYEEGSIPAWWGLQGRRVYPLNPSMRETGEYYAIHSDETGRFLRMRVQNESVRLVMPNDLGMDWNIQDHPGLSWDWRVRQMPAAAREDREQLDDTAGAIYVTFSLNFFGRPRSIKYTYSSNLPVGTVVSRGRLQVIVVASGSHQADGWIHIVRDVAEDYRLVFGKNPPDRPVSIAVWSDSDSTNSESEIDIDNILLLSHGIAIE